MTNQKSTLDSFNEFHAANPHIYELFKKQVFRAIDRGRKKVSARQIIEWLRWELHVTTNQQISIFDKLADGNKEFKISNNYTPYYARMFAAEYPQHRYMFEFRSLKSV